MTVSAADVSSALDEAVAAQRELAALDMADRANLVARLADVIHDGRATLAAIATREMGKPIAQAEAELDKCVRACRYFADHGVDHLAPESVASEFAESYVRFEPLGVVLAVMPWNFPYWQVIRLAAPAFVAGDAMVLKHASNVPRCAAAIESLVAAAGFPSGTLRSLKIPASGVRDLLCDPRIAAVCVTASSAAGADIASAAGAQLKKQVLELGGNDAFIVLDDADVALAAAAGITSRMLNAGQSCVAAKRFLVHAAIATEFTEALVRLAAELVVGDPWDRRTQIGPLARPDLLDELDRQVSRSVERGARVLLGGDRAGVAPGFYPPTVLTGVTPDMPVFREETFGPVIAVTAVDSDDDAVALANDSEYGLGASIWTPDLERAKAVAGRLAVGVAFINSRVSSDPYLPFGGIRRSGYGRELGAFGIRELTAVKAVAVNVPEVVQ